jgi:hypothetical protein
VVARVAVLTAYGWRTYKRRCDSDWTSYRHSPVTTLSPISTPFNPKRSQKQLCVVIDLTINRASWLVSLPINYLVTFHGSRIAARDPSEHPSNDARILRKALTRK